VNNLETAIIVPSKDANGSVLNDSPLRGIQLDIDGSDRARLRVEKAIRICFAGPIAQRKFQPASWRQRHAESDYSEISELAMRVSGSEKIATAFARWLELETEAMVNSNWAGIQRVARALIQHDTLNGAQVRDACLGPQADLSVLSAL
jgi:hypothetical protein